MARMNISVPDELRMRINAFGDQVNWSAIAQEAFVRQLNILEAKGTGDMETAVIERLRASKEKHQGGRKVDILRNVTAWCENHAEYDELQRIAKLHDVDYDVTIVDIAVKLKGFTDRNELSPEDIEDVREWFFGGDDPDERACAVMVEAVSDFWEKVEDQL